ncbi:unnamed protein product, partial [Amoebophrya sp. A120]
QLTPAAGSWRGARPARGAFLWMRTQKNQPGKEVAQFFNSEKLKNKKARRLGAGAPPAACIVPGRNHRPRPPWRYSAGGAFARVRMCRSRRDRPQRNARAPGCFIFGRGGARGG